MRSTMNGSAASWSLVINVIMTSPSIIVSTESFSSLICEYFVHKFAFVSVDCIGEMSVVFCGCAEFEVNSLISPDSSVVNPFTVESSNEFVELPFR